MAHFSGICSKANGSSPPSGPRLTESKHSLSLCALPGMRRTILVPTALQCRGGQWSVADPGSPGTQSKERLARLSR